MYDNGEADKALIEAGAWFIYAKWLARELECSAEMIRGQAVEFTKASEHVRFMEFGEMLKEMAVVYQVYPSLLVSHQAGMDMLERYNMEGGRLKEIYKRAHELGVPKDATDMFR